LLLLVKFGRMQVHERKLILFLQINGGFLRLLIFSFDDSSLEANVKLLRSQDLLADLLGVALLQENLRIVNEGINGIDIVGCW